MSTVSKRSIALAFAIVITLLSLTAFASHATTAPAVTDATTPSTSITVLPDSSTAPDTTAVPDSSSMMDTPLTTTPDTTVKDPDDGGFAYTGLVIALVVAGLVIALIILLVPKNKDKT